MIRLESGRALCESLGINNTITYLDLSFNALGKEGGLALGDALQDNKTLRTLIIVRYSYLICNRYLFWIQANNAINSVSCLTICAGILENENLQNFTVDGNPIGEEGSLMYKYKTYL